MKQVTFGRVEFLVTRRVSEDRENRASTFPRSRSGLILIIIVCCCWSAGSAVAAEPQQLTQDGRLKRDPVFIDGGKQIVYSVQHDSPQLVLRRLNLGDGRNERLHPNSALPEFRPSYSSDQKAISFLQMTGNDVLQLKVELPSQQRTVTIPASKKTVWHGTITPDGKQDIYSAAGQIYCQAVDKGKEKQLTQTAGRNNHPSQLEP